MRLAIAGCLALLPSVALAQEVSLGRADIDNVFVWRDADAHSEAFKLFQAGVHESQPELVFRLLSCLVPRGTKAVVTDGGIASSTVVITSGEHAGCRGVVPNEDIR